MKKRKNLKYQVWECIGNKYPYLCKVIDGGFEFVPTTIDYDCETVWHQKSQVSDNGEWYSFNRVIFKKNPNFNNIVCV